MQKISSSVSQPLYSVGTTRQIEQQASTSLPPHTLMQRAGLSAARLVLALAPHAQRIWIACGPGNNGGDGFEAALHLHQWGKSVVVTWIGLPDSQNKQSPDAQKSRERALAAGVLIASEAPKDFDFCVDALLGIGAKVQVNHPDAEQIQRWLDAMAINQVPRLAIDIPTGLHADTGSFFAINSVADYALPVYKKSIFTLSFLTLKPGLFMASGRDRAGEIWFDDLGIHVPTTEHPCAWLLGADRSASARRLNASHASHKGSFGDVAILGGQSAKSSHMTGAALLAARAALHAGAGRVLVALLGDLDSNSMTVDPAQPELMFRSPEALDMKHQVIVCGCGGGEAVKTVLAKVLLTASRLVIAADALNAIADDVELQNLLKARTHYGYSTVLTPHPLEAARLAGITAAEVQASRLKVAVQLAERYACVVVLKGSGTVIAAPHQLPFVNATGNALLATAGTGDVLAGIVGACIASGLGVFEASCHAVFRHGEMADIWREKRPEQLLTASRLADFQL